MLIISWVIAALTLNLNVQSQKAVASNVNLYSLSTMASCVGMAKSATITGAVWTTCLDQFGNAKVFMMNYDGSVNSTVGVSGRFATISSDPSVPSAIRVVANADGISDDVYICGYVTKQSGLFTTMFLSKINSKNPRTVLFVTEWGSGNSSSYAADLQVDSANNIVAVAGTLGNSGKLYFMGNKSTTALNKSGPTNGSVVLSFLNTNGTVLNNVVFGSFANFDDANGVSKARDGNFYVVGTNYNSTLGIAYGFIARVNASTTGSTANVTYYAVPDEAFATQASNSISSIYVGGNTATSNGYYASSVSKYAIGSNFLNRTFTTVFGATNNDYVYGVATNPTTDILVTVGSTQNNVTVLNAGGADILYA